MQVVPIEVGSPGQRMQAIPDTGSFELVIPSTECGSGCNGHPLFDSTNSTSFEYRGTKQTIHYGQGDVGTEVDYDTVHLGGMSVQQQSLLKMSYNGLENYDLASYDAVMGLGLSEQARPGDADLSLLASLSEKVFGICLGQADGEAGRLDLGGGLPGVEWMPELSCTKATGHWGLTLGSVKLGDVQLGGKMSAIVDSGTSLFAMPTETYEQALDAIGEVNEDCSNVAELPPLTLHVDNDHTFTIPPELYVGRVAIDDLEALEALMGGAIRRMRNKHTNDGAMGVDEAHLRSVMRFRGRKGGGGRGCRGKAASSARCKGKAGDRQTRKNRKQQQLMSKPSILDDAPSEGTICLPLLMELNVYSDEGPLFILGMPFLRAYASRFNLGRKTIAFAKLPLDGASCTHCASAEGADGFGRSHLAKNSTAVAAAAAAAAAKGAAQRAAVAADSSSSSKRAQKAQKAGQLATEQTRRLPPEVMSLAAATTRRAGPLRVNMRRARLPWWAVRESVPQNASLPMGSMGYRGPWRHLML